MIVYVYDGSFEGLLTAVHEAYYRKDKPEKIVCGKNLQNNFLEQYIFIETDIEKSKKVYTAIGKKIYHTALQNLYYVYLSEIPEAGTLIYEYLKLGFKIGREVDFHLADDRVLKVYNVSRRVTLERHRMLGFVRFRLIEGNIYYALIKPDYNIVELLAPHFAERLSDQNWIIHDTGRSLSAVYNCSEWVVVKGELGEIPELEENEGRYQKLWKEFFNSIAISNRTNPRLQKRMMPVRYWRNLTEKW